MEPQLNQRDPRQEESAVVTLAALAPFDRIVVTTVNHQYELVVVSPSHYTVLVRGGALTEFVPGCLIGSAHSGDPLQPGTIAVGRRVEMAFDDRRLFTSAVQQVAVIRATAPDLGKAAA